MNQHGHSPTRRTASGWRAMTGVVGLGEQTANAIRELNHRTRSADAFAGPHPPAACPVRGHQSDGGEVAGLDGRHDPCVKELVSANDVAASEGFKPTDRASQRVLSGAHVVVQNGCELVAEVLRDDLPRFSEFFVKPLRRGVVA